MITAGVPTTRPIRVLLLPSRPYTPYRRNYVPGSGPDPHAFRQELATLGIVFDTLDPSGFPFNPLAGKHPLLQSIDPYRTLKVLLRRRAYDLIISGNEGAAVLLVLLRRWFRFDTPVVVWDLAPSSEWRLRAFLQDLTLPKVDGIMALIAIQKQYIAERWGPQIPVTVVGYSVDTEFYRPTVPSCSGDYLLSVGDDAGRDYETLLRAADTLPIALRIRTSMPLFLDPVRHSNIQIIGDRFDPPAFRSLYAGCNFVILPLLPHTRNASGASTVLETAAMGKAAIVSDSDGVRDFIVPGETCLTVPAGDAGALRAAIERLCREPETCLRLGTNARQFVQDRFSTVAAARLFASAVREHAHPVPRRSSLTATVSG